MVFIKKLPLISLISSKKNDTQSSTEAPPIKYEDNQVRAFWLLFVVFYPFSEVSLGSVKVAFLTRAHICCIPVYIVCLLTRLPVGIKNWFAPLFFLIALFFWLKILQICNLIKPPLGRCYTWGTGYSHGDRNENILIPTVLKWLGNCNHFPVEWHIIRSWIVLIDDLVFCL